MILRPRRSLLYVPGSNGRALEKARSLAADALIFDLEDSAAPGVKAMARNQAVEAIRAGGFGRREIVIRVNALGSEWANADIEAAAGVGPHAVLAPKIASAHDVLRASRALDRAGAPQRTRIWAMIETAEAALEVRAIAQAARIPGSRLDLLVLGTNDLARETHARPVPGRAPMLAWLSLAVAAARACGIDVVDGVFDDFRDLDGLRRECEQGRDFGMDGKTLIHPEQIGVCNEVFAPTAEEIEQARKIVAAFEAPANADKGVIALDGRMVERLHADIARRTLAMAAAIEGLSDA